MIKDPTSVQEDKGSIPSLTQLNVVAVAVVQASSYTYNLTPSLGTSICFMSGPKKKIKTEKGLSGRRSLSCGAVG